MREGSERRIWLCPRAEPHHSKTEPHKPYTLCQTPKYPSPSTLLLFFHFIFRSVAPVSSFLFVFGSYYSWLPSVFWFPSSALIRMFILTACFSTFLRCLLVVAGQRSVFGLGKGSHVAGLGPDHHLETPAWSRGGEALGTVIAPSRNVAGVGMWNSRNRRAGSRVMGSGGKRSQTVSEELQGTIVMCPRSARISSSPGSCLTHISTSPGCQCSCALRSLEKQARPASASAY